MTRGARTRVAAGIYRDTSGVSGTVKTGGRQRERRFAPDTPLEEIRKWQVQVRAQMQTEAVYAPAPSPSTRGTLASDILRYLKMLEGRPSYQSDKSHLRAWEPLYGPRRRAQLRPEDVQLAIAQWLTEKIAAQTIIHRCRVLRQLYRALDGRLVPTPVDHVQRPPKPKPVPTSVPLATIYKVAARLADHPIDHARFAVLATTGQRPAQMKRALVDDVDLKRRIWMVRTAKGSTARELYLNADMVKAWRLFIKADAWGEYDATAFARLLRRCGWPSTIRPYNLRHSFAVAALESGIDLGDVQGMLGHASIDTTRRFYAAILESRLKKASLAMVGRWEVPADRASGGASGRRADRAISRKKRTGRATTAVGGKQ